MVTTVVTSTTQSISAGVLLDLSHNNGHLIFLTKDKPCCVPTQKGWFHSRGILRIGSPKGIKPRDRAELLKDADKRRFSPEPDVAKSDSAADS